MSSSDFQLDSLNPPNLQVMQAYDVRTSAAKAASEDYDGWLERLDTLDDFTTEELTRLHGQLIAMGFLKFEITGRSVGLRYQISPRGRQAMDRAIALAERDAAETLAVEEAGALVADAETALAVSEMPQVSVEATLADAA